MKFIIHSKIGCTFCEKAKDWFTSNNLTYEEILHNDDSERQEFYESLGNNVRTVPQIFAQYKEGDDWIHLGGYTDLIQSDILDKKDPVLDDEDF